MKVFVPIEHKSGERRIALTPETIKKMVKKGLNVEVEPGAGDKAYLFDDAMTAAGATLGDGWSSADVVVKVTPPTAEETRRIQAGALLISFVAPHQERATVQALVDGKVNCLAMELVPRITRAQSMDALSSQASIAGYRAVLLAAARLGKYFPLLMTAAGTIPPAKVVIMGAGVAGLQAIATAKRLGAVVEVSDIRPVVQEQVESLGGKFIELPLEESGEGEGGYAKQMGEDFLRKQREIVHRHVAAADVVITTALVPGKKAPMLVPASMVEAMQPGSVIVDLAVEQGGNCELSRADEEVDHNGVIILGPSNLAAGMAHDASTLFGRNVLALLEDVLDDEGKIVLDPESNDVVAGALLTRDGEIFHPATAAAFEESGS
ncbi:MAG: Re/Si-specific NAD(P)(+) transhydrogenase subunit alpha [Acidobacteriota bacterium]